jgi:hypothetical protein
LKRSPAWSIYRVWAHLADLGILSVWIFSKCDFCQVFSGAPEDPSFLLVSTLSNYW